MVVILTAVDTLISEIQKESCLLKARFIVKFPGTILSGGLALLVISFLPISNARANDHANEVFHHCQQELEHLTRHCVMANYELAHECVHIIRHLLEHGHFEEAAHVAHVCIHRIEHQTLRCLHEMAELCESCIHILHELGAHELAHRFRANCHAASEIVIESARISIHAIKALFDGP